MTTDKHFVNDEREKSRGCTQSDEDDDQNANEREYGDEWIHSAWISLLKYYTLTCGGCCRACFLCAQQGGRREEKEETGSTQVNSL